MPVEGALQCERSQVLDTQVVAAGNDDDPSIHETGLGGNFVNARGVVVQQTGEHGAGRVAAQQHTFANSAETGDVLHREPGVERLAARFQNGHVARDHKRARVRLSAQRLDERGVVAPFGKTIQREAGITDLGGDFTKGRDVGGHLFSSVDSRVHAGCMRRRRQPSSMISSAKACMRSGAPALNRKLSQIQL